ncbi:hypothetical protein SDC9_110420 [bioreactor metagenome]|uniref:Uncharacterized protein n=1 Tax=bioreactor metagenome TaxID=1076179 RepID=A0A645BDK0_9ZZZZ
MNKRIKKYECDACLSEHGQPCVIEWGDFPAPGRCPYSGGKADWKEIKEEQLPKLTIEALAERGIAWPEWAGYAVVSTAEYAYFCDKDGEQHQEIPGKWDASDWAHSKIFNPAQSRFPEWCKAGNWVWSAALRAEFARITGPGKTSETMAAVTEEGFDCLVLVTDEAISCGATKPARIRPWTFEEAPPMLKMKVGGHCGTMYLNTMWVNHVETVGYCYLKSSDFYSLEKIAQKGAQFDGSPCGVLEIAEDSK